MVFNLPETTPPSPSMASTFSARSHPLHNFRLSNLKWPMNHSNHHHHHRSSRKNGDSDHGIEQLVPSSMIKLNANSSGGVHHESYRKKGLSVISGTECVTEKKKKEEKKLAVAMSSIESSEKKLIGNTGIRVEKNEEKLKVSEGKPKLLIRLPARNKAAVQEHQCDVEEEEPVAARTWNLRPRRTASKPLDVNGGAPQEQSRPEMAPAQAVPKEKVAHKRKEFSVSLLKEEIEEDFLILTGSRPPRRPKKRARNVQKQLDEIFPGLWLPTSVTPDMYSVPDASQKG